MTVVRLAVEGKTDAPVAERIVRLVGLVPRTSFVAGGKTKLDPRIPGLNRLAARTNWLILRDFDHDAPCPPALVHNLMAGQTIAPRLSLRIAVRALESWLLADIEGFSSEFSVKREHVPANPDDRDNPKKDLVQACGHSIRGEIRRAMTPHPRSGRKVGREYTSRVIRFANNRWSPERAAQRSPSLHRALEALRRLVADGAWS